MPTLYQEFVQRWHDCSACDLYKVRRRVVLARGCLPADVAFIGEGPGKSEDSLGLPFKGAAGKRLDDIVAASVPTFRLCPKCRTVLRSYPDRKECRNQHNYPPDEVGLPVRAVFSNLICCIPWDEETGAKTPDLPEESVKACSVRLIEFMEIANPRLIIAVGKEAEQWLEPGYRHSIKLHQRIPLVRIDHPSYILRQNLAQQNLLTRRAIVAVTTAIDKTL